MKQLLFLLAIFSSSIAIPVLISGYSAPVEIYDLANNALTLSKTYESIGSLTYWGYHPTNASIMYAIWESVEDGRLKSFVFGDNDLVETASIAVGNGPVHVTIEPQGRFAYTAGYTSGNITVVSILPSGVLGNVVQSIPNGALTHQTQIDPATGKYLYAPAITGNSIGQFIVNADGTLTANGKLDFPAGTGPRHFKFLPGNPSIAFTISETSSEIFTLNVKDGVLSIASKVKATNVTTTSYGSTILVSSDGKFLYAGNRDQLNTSSITVWSIDSKGALTQIQYETAGGDINFPKDFNWDNEEKFIVVANTVSSTITTFSRSATTGLLTKISTQITKSASPAFVGVKPIIVLPTSQVTIPTGSGSDEASGASTLFCGLFLALIALF